MKTKFSAIVTLLAFVIANAMSFAETPECLSRNYNRVTGIAAGDTARVQTWDFSSASNIEGNLALKRRAVSDSLYADSWLGMNYTFIKKNNVIYCTERSNRLISAKDTLGTIEMIAPMSIGYTAASDYVFFGNYSKELQMIEKGHSHSVFDSVGTLILPNDTIEDVKRVRTTRPIRFLWMTL